MKSWAAGLYVSLFAVGVAASCFVGGPVTEVVVADKTLSPAQLKELAGRVGRVRNVEPDGFLPVRARGTLESAKRRLHELGIDYVFSASSRDLAPNNLKSVRNHIAYQEAKKALLAGPGEEEGVDFYEALAFYLERRVEPDGQLDPERWKRAAAHRAQMPKWKPGGKAALGPTGAWEHIGPFGLDVPYRTYYGVPPLSGRKTAMAYAPSNASRIYCISGGSGVWRSDDGGVSWTPKSDGWTFMQGNSVAVDPLDPNIVYVGTGDYDQGVYPFGLMKSTDGGNTWTNYGQAQFGNSIIQKIIIDPADRNTLVMCTSLGGAQRGIWRSTDAGVNWTQVLNSGISMLDMDVSVNNGGRDWYAVAGGGVVGGRIYKSPDGINWTQIFSPSGATENRMDVACSKIDRNTLYLLATGEENIYKSTTGGSSWVSVKNNFPNGGGPGPNYNWSQKTYDYYIGTTKNGANDVVIVGLITVAASFNGGSTWTDIAITYTNSAKAHNDNQTMANHPTDDGTILLGSDGGIFHCVLNPATSSANITPLNDEISDEMAYAIALHPTDPTRIMIGTQDNATPASRGNLNQWDNLQAGDGGWCAFDKNNPQIHYTTSQGLNVYRYTTDNDPSASGITGPWTNAAFIAPLIIAGNGSELFAGSTDYLWKWNSGTNWTQRPQDVSGTGTLVYLAAAPSNGNVIYTGANNGQVWRTPDQGVNFTRIDGGLPDSGVGAICVSPTNPNDIMVSVGNAGLLYRCTDTTAAVPVWTAINGTAGMALPAVPVNGLAFDPHYPATIYAGTDVGVFMSTNGGTAWSNMTGFGLPNVMVADLEINDAKTHLYAATYGRGVWRVALEPPSYPVTGWVRENGTGLPGSSVRLMQGANLITTATPDANGNYTLNAPSGTFTLVPFHPDRSFSPQSRALTVPPAASAQNFTAGPVGPVSITWQYQAVVYSDQSRQGTLNLNVTNPSQRDVAMSDNSLKLTSPIKVTVPAGIRSQTFFVYGVTVAADTPVTVTASHQGLTASAMITVRPKPVLQTMTLAKASVKGGHGVSGTVTINKPAIGPMGLYLTSSNTSLATISPNPTAFYNGVTSKGFYCKTFPVATTQVVTFTATFYGSTRSVPLTLTP